MVKNEGYFVLVDTISSREKKYYYTSDNALKIGDKVVVDTQIGLELGVVCSEPVRESNLQSHEGFNQIVRKCCEEDLEKHNSNCDSLDKIKEYFDACVNKLNLDMKLISACYNLDRSKLLFMYVSDRRVDFRSLLKELSSKFKCRIELRQIGPRDRSKITGGLGLCGLPICCASFLNEFEGISINMAKNQLLALNIQKLSGQCGKLLCCLKFEDEYYSKAKYKYPKLGTRVKYEDDFYRVASVNILSNVIRIENNNRENIYNLTLEEFNKIKRSK